MGNSFGNAYIQGSSCNLCRKNFDPLEANRHFYSLEHIRKFLEKHVPTHLQVLNPCFVDEFTTFIQLINSKEAPTDSTMTIASASLQLLFIWLCNESLKQAAMVTQKPRKTSSNTNDACLDDILSYERIYQTRTNLGLSNVEAAVNPNATHSRSTKKRLADPDTIGSRSNMANEKHVDSLLLGLVRDICAWHPHLGSFSGPMDELLNDIVSNRKASEDLIMNPDDYALLEAVRLQLGLSRGLVDPLGKEGEFVLRVIKNIDALFYLQSVLYPGKSRE